ncbi:MAG: hypothetical protein GY857_21345, partial [Desulfobacula sp.]|nr:hypothetical protein [Desulfobacula sp.]
EGYSTSDSNPARSSGGGGGGGGGCFIATAAFGSPMDKHVQILKEFRDVYLLKSRPGAAFVKTYYKYSPPVADIIAKHGILKSVVRIGLMPLILFGYITIHISMVVQIMFFILIIGAVISLKFKSQNPPLTMD